MIVRSATGPVDLSRPENIRRGMVFRLAAADKPRHFVATERATVTMWQSAQGILFEPCELGWRFLGCDPAHAARGDCERFGLAPGIDAGAHGLARTREGFAVDLRRECIPGPIPAGTIMGFRGERCGPLPEALGLKPWAERFLSYEARFVGLDARLARAEDFKRLCCRHRDPRGYLCSLALGEHEQHEDIAAGAKWPAAPMQSVDGTLTFSRGADETDDVLRGRIREEYAAASVHRSLAGEPEPGTENWIRAEIKRLGWGCRVASGVGVFDVVVYGSTWGQCDGIGRHLSDGMPLVAQVHVEAAECPVCGCDGLCEWRLSVEEDPGAVTCKTCQCRWCGPKKETGPAWTTTAAGYETTLRGYKVTVGRSGDVWRYEVSDWAGAVIGQRATEREAKEHALRAVPGQPSSSPMFGPCATLPDFKVSTAWADVPACPDGLVAVRVGGSEVVGSATRELHYVLRARDILGGEVPRVIATKEEADRVFGEGSWMAGNVGAMLRNGAVYLDSGECNGSRVEQGERRTTWGTVPALCACGSRGNALTTSGAAGAAHGARKGCEVSAGWADAPAWADASGVVSAAELNAISKTLTFTRADIPEATTWSVVTFEEAYPPPLNLAPQAAALRSAMVTIDALPWAAADKRALRNAAHAVAEMVEATDGKAPARLRGPATEMLAALAAAAHVGPAIIGDATKARDAARAAMPRRQK